MLPFAWWGAAKKDEVTQNLASSLVAAATRALTVDRFITKAASAAFGDALALTSSSRTTAAKTLASGLTAAASSSLQVSVFITKAASAAFGDSLALESEDK